MFVFLGNKQERLAFTTFPAVLKACSAGNDVPGMHKYFRTIVENKGNCIVIFTQDSGVLLSISIED